MVQLLDRIFVRSLSVCIIYTCCLKQLFIMLQWITNKPGEFKNVHSWHADVFKASRKHGWTKFLIEKFTERSKESLRLIMQHTQIIWWTKNTAIFRKDFITEISCFQQKVIAIISSKYFPCVLICFSV